MDATVVFFIGIAASIATYFLGRIQTGELITFYRFVSNTILNHSIVQYDRVLSATRNNVKVVISEFVPEESREEWCQHILDELQWKGPVFKTSGLMSEGTKEVVYYLMDQIEQQREREVEDPEYAAEIKALREQLEAETREQTIAAKEAYRAMRKAQREADLDDDEDFDDDEDEGGVESIYVRD